MKLWTLGYCGSVDIITEAIFQFVTTMVEQLEYTSPATVTIGFAPDSGVLTTPVSINVSSQTTGSASCKLKCIKVVLLVSSIIPYSVK